MSSSAQGDKLVVGSPITFTRDDLDALAAVAGLQTTVLSPLGQSEANHERRAALGDIGIIDASGRIAQEHAASLDVLGRPTTVARLELADAQLFQFGVYGSDGEEVSLTAIDGQIRLERPAPIDTMLGYVSNVVGRSIMIGTDFRISLAATEALVFAAAIDDYRRRVLRALADGRSDVSPPERSAIAEELARPRASYLCLSWAVRGALGSSDLPTPTEIASALSSLAAAGHIHFDGHTYELADAARAFASQFLNMNLVLTLFAAHDGPEGPSSVGLTCLVAGLHDVVALERTGDRISMETLSSADVLRLAEAYLRNPRAIAEAAPPRGQAVPDTATSEAPTPAKYCASCGHQLLVDDRFCGRCGADQGANAR